MYQIIVNLSNNKTLTYNFVDSYEIMDDGSTIRFTDSKTQETKRFPYINCVVNEKPDNEKESGINGFNARRHF